MQKLINKEMTVGEVVQKYPEAIEVMSAYGLHCAGCSVNYLETIEQGAMGHGMPVKMVEKMVEEMNSVLEKSGALESEGKAITLSFSAAEKIRELMKKEGRENNGLLVAVQKGGCSGQTYILQFEEKQQENFAVFEEKGVKVFVPQEHIEMLQGIRIDYVDSLQGSGFKIVNPNVHRTCGCGQSFR